jgi:hypothetical protein
VKVRCGKVAGSNRESIVCTGGRDALGMEVDFDATYELLDRYAAVLVRGSYPQAIEQTIRLGWKPLPSIGEPCMSIRNFF